MEIFRDVTDHTVRVRPPVAEQRKAAPSFHNLLAIEFGDHDFLVTVTRLRDDLAQRIDRHALSRHLPFALAAHVIAGRQEHAVF